MAVVIDQLITKYVMDASGYQKGASDVTSSTNSLSSVVGGSLGVVAAIATGLAASIGAVGLAMKSLGQAAFDSASKFEAQAKGLEAIEGSAEKAKAALKDLRAIAMEPGLGYSSSVQGYARLRAAGLPEGMSKAVVREFGNQNAKVGGGPEVMDRILLAISQIATTPYLQGDELRQLTEAGIPAYKMVKDSFGTSDTEELKKMGVTSNQVISTLVQKLSQMPRAAGGATNAISNISDAWDQMLASVGGPILKAITPFLTQFGNALATIASSGVLESVASGISMVSDSFGAAKYAALAVAAGITGLIKAFELLSNGIRFMVINIFNNIQHIPFIGKMLTGGGTVEGFVRAMDLTMETFKMLSDTNNVPSTADLIAGDPKVSKIAEAQLAITKQVEKNTRPLIDFTKKALGGGEVGAVGVTTSEINHLKGKSGRSNKIEQAVQLIHEAAVESAMKTLSNSRRLGFGGG